MVWKGLVLASALLATTAASQQTGVCTGPEAYRQADGHDYRGYVNTTISGITCQKWSAQSPHTHGTVVPDLLNGIGDDNYCRNPTGAPYAGCYTTDPSIRFERCDIGLPCTAPITQAPKDLVIEPAPGLELLQGSTITLTCVPRPCDVFYTLDGSEPTVQSTLYTRPIPAPSDYVGPFLLRTKTVFADGTQRFDRATYVEHARTPMTAATLYPPPIVVYAKPVLVSVLTTTNVSVYLFFQNDTTPQLYTEPFWIYATTTVTAVAGDNVQTATYQVQTSPRLPAFYPTSGTYYGSVKVAFIPTVTREVFFVRINGNGWTRVEDGTITIDRIGTSVVEVQSQSIDTPTSAIETVMYTIAPLSPPSCYPPSGTYNTTVAVTCYIGDSDVPVQQLCSGAADSSRMACDDTSSVAFTLPGSYVIAATYYDSTFAPQTAMFTYTLEPRQLAQPIVSPCGGYYANEVVATALTGDNVTLTYAGAAGVSVVNQTDATGAVIALAGDKPAPAAFSVAVTSHSTMEIAPAQPKACVVALYPNKGEVMPTQWFLVPSTLYTLYGSTGLATRVASAMMAADASIVEVRLEFGRYTMVRAKVHPVIARAYTARLYKALVGIAGDGLVLSETGVIPADEIRELPLAQNITKDEQACAATCKLGQAFTIPCSCGSTAADASTAVPTFGVATSFVAASTTMAVATPVTVRLQWTGRLTNVTAKAVIAAFGCGDLGYPLQFIDATSAVFTPRYSAQHTVCVDDGKGFYELATNTPLHVGMAQVAATPSLAPCGGTFTTPITVAVTGDTKTSRYTLDGLAWAPLPSTLTIPIQSYGTSVVLTVVSDYMDPLTQLATLADTFVCIYTFGQPPTPAPVGISYTFDRVGEVEGGPVDGVARVRIAATSANGDVSLSVSSGKGCSGNTTSYTSVEGPAVVTDEAFLLAASVNSTLPYTVCASLNANPSVLVPLTPSKGALALSPIALMVNSTCAADVCGPTQLCLVGGLCGCKGANGTLAICAPDIPEGTTSGDFTIVLLAIAAIVVPIALGMGLFYAARTFNGKSKS